MKYFFLLIILFITSCGVKNYGFFHNRAITFSHNEKNTSTGILNKQKDTFLLEEKNYYPIASLLNDYIPLVKQNVKQNKNKIRKIMDSIPKKDTCDIIFLQNGISFLAVVTKQTATSIVYKKCGSTSEFQEILNASEVKYIQYKDSKKEEMQKISAEQKIEHSKRMQKISYYSLSLLDNIFQRDSRTSEQIALDDEINKSKITEPLGVRSLTAGILSLLLSYISLAIFFFFIAKSSFPLAILLICISLCAILSGLSIGLGIKSLKNLKNNRDIYKGWNFPRLGIVFGSVALAFSLLILFLFLFVFKY